MKRTKKLRKIMGTCLAVSVFLSLMPGMMPGVSAQIPAASGAMETFEDAAFETEGVEGTTLFTGTSSRQDFDIGSNLHLILEGVGTKVEICTDPVTSSKAMKITHPGSGTIQLLNYYAGNTNTGTYINSKIIKTGCKVRLASQKNTAITRFNRIDNNGVTVSGSAIYNKKFAVFTDRVVEINDFQTMPSDSYVSTSTTYNYATNKVVRQSGAATSEGSGNSQTQFNRTWYRFEAPGTSYTSNAWKGADADTTEIWLDDLFFETYAYEPQISVAGQAGVYKNGASYTSASLTGIPINAPIEVRFNGECSDDAVSTEAYTLKDSQNRDIAFTVERFADNIITVYPKYQIGGETYTFTAKAGITSAENAAIDTRTARSVTYTTVTNGLSFHGFVESENFDNIAENIYTATTPSSNFLGGKIDIRQNVNNESIGVVTDAVTGNKALRMHIGNANSTGKYLWVLPEAYTSGRFVTTFDVRMASCDIADNGYFMSFGSSTATDGRSSGWTNRMKSQTYWSFKDVNSIDQWTSKGNWDSSVYFPAMMSIDFASTTFSGQVYRKYGTDSQSLISKSNSFASASNCDNLKYIQLGQLKKYNSSSDASDIYIDNLRVAQYDYDDFVVGNVQLSGNTLSADVTNNTAGSQACVAIGVQFDSTGRFLAERHESLNLSAGGTENISFGFTAPASVFELYLWDSLTGLHKLTEKKVVNGSGS